MAQQSAGQLRRASLHRFARRAVVLAALGTGLWLGGQTSASADELTPPATAVGMPSSAVDAVPIPSVGLRPPATSAVDPGAALTASSVTRAAEPGPAVLAPVAPVPVVPVVSAVHSTVVPVTDLADPIVQAAEPVLEAATPLQGVAAPVVAAVGQAVAPLAEAVPLAGAVNSLLAPAAGALTPLLCTDPIQGQQPADADFHGWTQAVHDPAAGTDGAGRVMARAGDGVITPDPGGAGGVPVPVRPSTPATGGPARAGCTGTQSFDQSPADLSAAVLDMITAAMVANGDARDPAGILASDPSFSPD